MYHRTGRCDQGRFDWGPFDWGPFDWCPFDYVALSQQFLNLVKTTPQNIINLTKNQTDPGQTDLYEIRGRFDRRLFDRHL